MPWKPTKLKFFGIAIRRRTLYALTVFFGALSAPTLAWAILVQQVNMSANEKYGYMALAAFFLFCTFKGWFLIVRNNPLLYRDEARNIWVGGLVLTALVTAGGCIVADTVIRPARLAYGAPLAIGGAVMLFLVVRLCLLSRHPKKGDIVRGESGPLRKKSRSSQSGVPPTLLAAHQAAAEALGGDSQDDEDLDDELAVEEDSAPPQPGK